MRSARWLLLLCGVLVGCGRSAPPTPAGIADPGDPAARAHEAEAALRHLGEGRFTVASFQVLGETRLTFRDDYDYPTKILALTFTATIRATAEVDIPGAEELMAREIEPDLSLPDLERDAALLTLFDEGELHPGNERTIRAAAAFDLLEPGHRFRLFDRAPKAAP